uniref:Rho-GAP domain-containing protein n=1 Tax=Syphacia muris TaxID=451379 RepID=A0A0N5AVZ4_9BILA
MRRSYLKEGEVQLTALNSLLTQSRYLFLFSDLLLVAKQKAENSYKLKEKVRLDRLWIASNNCPHSFVIGWPICNYIAHFPSEEKKAEWHDILEERIQKCRLRAIPKFTTLPLITMKKKLSISQTSSEILLQLIGELGLSRDLELDLAFDNGGGDEPTVLQGPETVYCIIMDFIRSTGYRLSEKQLERLDTFPLVNCKLVLLSSNLQKSNAAQTLVTHFKRVLSRNEPRRFFGRQLDGSCPPQPVLTMMDHLLANGVHTEGLFRKSPKQTTVRMVKAQLNRGSVPDFTQFSPHVTAAILKEYLRSIPGKLLQTCDLNMWIAAIESDGPERIAQIKGFLQLLPSSHIVLLSSLLRLLRAVAKSPSSKMNAQSLAVCIAPNLLDSPKMECAARRLPQIAEWLITNAPLLFDDFVDAHCDISSSASNDSGLSDVEVGVEAPLSSEFTETYIISTPASSVPSVNSSPVVRCKIEELKVSPSSYCSSNLSTDDEMDITPEIERDDDRTPVLSQENSDVEKKPVAYIEWKSAKRFGVNKLSDNANFF